MDRKYTNYASLYSALRVTITITLMRAQPFKGHFNTKAKEKPALNATDE